MKLTSTYFELPEYQMRKMAKGYQSNTPVNLWGFKAMAGAGALKSNIQDLLAYGAAIFNEEPNQLKKAIKLVKQKHHTDKKVTIGLGWHFSNNLIWHNAGTAGFSSILIIDPIHNTVAAGITNTGTHNVEDLVNELIRMKKKQQ